MGASLAYGGDLRKGGFTRTLISLLRTYSREDRPAAQRVRFYLAQPVWSGMSEGDAADLALYGTPVRVGGTDDGVGRREGEALDYRAMRKRMINETDARVAVGGRLAGQSGRWPGIAEEAYFALREAQPLFLVGGLGGAADRVAQALRGEWPVEFTTEYQLAHTDGYRDLLDAGVGTSESDLRQVLTGAGLQNGLSDDENAVLFKTADLDLVVALILRGLTGVAEGER